MGRGSDTLRLHVLDASGSISEMLPPEGSIQLTCRELGPPFAPSIDPQALGGEDGAGAGEEAALRVGGAGGAGQAGRGLEDPPLLPPELLLAAAQGAGAL